MTNYDVVVKLVGPIDPVGETNADGRRFENLVAMCELADALLTDIDSVATYNKDRVEHSMRKAGRYAAEFQDRMGICE
jgi:hypothetical protein